MRDFKDITYADVEFIGSVPRAASGKILRRELRDRETRQTRGAEEKEST